ncbi:hypothetical protein K458DRAFT_399823 [Lentithecium fluviatile CBS 122367]|uniref:Uncharacterized protein n=1 Tax=Lentithecium fluviatile CBS 122367 TaxID=1168545 RepID=A0A6G1JIZ3_9PLEO|nr:hypothetical protein K458DRAFT_399823 [Lentithecium fluviatile CBS 122367]
MPHPDITTVTCHHGLSTTTAPGHVLHCHCTKRTDNAVLEDYRRYCEEHLDEWNPHYPWSREEGRMMMGRAVYRARGGWCKEIGSGSGSEGETEESESDSEESEESGESESIQTLCQKLMAQVRTREDYVAEVVAARNAEKAKRGSNEVNDEDDEEEKVIDGIIPIGWVARDSLDFSSREETPGLETELENSTATMLSEEDEDALMVKYPMVQDSPKSVECLKDASRKRWGWGERSTRKLGECENVGEMLVEGLMPVGWTARDSIEVTRFWYETGVLKTRGRKGRLRGLVRRVVGSKGGDGVEVEA